MPRLLLWVRRTGLAGVQGVSATRVAVEAREGVRVATEAALGWEGVRVAPRQGSSAGGAEGRKASMLRSL